MIFLFHFILGSKLERAQLSLTSMGPAIVNGGITTFLALLLLGFSQSHVFVTFFKVSYHEVLESQVFVTFFQT
jgi:Niemann-Pick C1 protein